MMKSTNQSSLVAPRDDEQQQQQQKKISPADLQQAFNDLIKLYVELRIIPPVHCIDDEAEKAIEDEQEDEEEETRLKKRRLRRIKRELESPSASSSSSTSSSSSLHQLLVSELDRMFQRRQTTIDLVREIEKREGLLELLMKDLVAQAESDQQQQKQPSRTSSKKRKDLSTNVRRVIHQLTESTHDVLTLLRRWAFTIELDENEQRGVDDDDGDDGDGDERQRQQHEERLVELCSRFRFPPSSSSSYLQKIQDDCLGIISSAALSPFLGKESREMEELLFLASDATIVYGKEQVESTKTQFEMNQEKQAQEREQSSHHARSSKHRLISEEQEVRQRQETRNSLADIAIGLKSNVRRLESAASGDGGGGGGIGACTGDRERELAAETTFDQVEFRPASNTTVASSSAPSSISAQKVAMMNHSQLIQQSSGTSFTSNSMNPNPSSQGQPHHSQRQPTSNPADSQRQLQKQPDPSSLSPLVFPDYPPGTSSLKQPQQLHSNNNNNNNNDGDNNNNNDCNNNNNNNNFSGCGPLQLVRRGSSGIMPSTPSDFSARTTGTNSASSVRTGGSGGGAQQLNHNNNKSVVKFGEDNVQRQQTSDNQKTTNNSKPSLASLGKLTFGHHPHHHHHQHHHQLHGRPQSSITPQPKSISSHHQMMSNQQQQQSRHHPVPLLLPPVASSTRGNASPREELSSNASGLTSPLSAGHDHFTAFRKTEVLTDHDPQQFRGETNDKNANDSWNLPPLLRAASTGAEAPPPPPPPPLPGAASAAGERPWTATTTSSTANNINGLQRLITTNTQQKKLSLALAFAHSGHVGSPLLAGSYGLSGSPAGGSIHEGVGLDEEDESTFRGSPASRRASRARGMSFGSKNASPRSNLTGESNRDSPTRHTRHSRQHQNLVRIGSVDLPVLTGDYDYDCSDEDDEESDEEEFNEQSSPNSPSPKRPSRSERRRRQSPDTEQHRKGNKEQERSDRQNRQLALAILKMKGNNDDDASTALDDLLRRFNGDADAVVRELAQRHGIDVAVLTNSNKNKSKNETTKKSVIYVEKKRTKQIVASQLKSPRSRIEHVLRQASVAGADTVSMIPKTKEEFDEMVRHHKLDMMKKSGTIFASDEEAALSLLETLKEQFGVQETEKDKMKQVIVAEEEETYYEEAEEEEVDDDGSGLVDASSEPQRQQGDRFEYRIVKDEKTGQEKVIRVLKVRQLEDDDKDKGDDSDSSSSSSSSSAPVDNAHATAKQSRRKERQLQEKRDRCIAILETFAPDQLAHFEQLLNNRDNKGSIETLLNNLMLRYYYDNDNTNRDEVNPSDKRQVIEAKQQQVERRIRELRELRKRVESSPLSLGIVIKMQAVVRRMRTRRAFLQAQAIWRILGIDVELPPSLDSQSNF